MPPRRSRTQHGFTLVELVLVIVITGVIAATLTVFVRPAIESYLTSRSRADLTDQAETALRRMVNDVRVAVPNSIRTPSSQCFELIPTSTGGRYRSGPDTVNDALSTCSASTCSAWIDTSQATTAFDVLSPLSATPAAGDWVVVGNQNPADVYGGVNRAAIASVGTPANAAFGRHRLTVASTAFPIGYDGGRFTVVPNAQRAVFYVCSGADGTLDASGNGKGTLYRLMNYGFNASYPSACPSTAGAAVLASQVRSCTFTYDPNQGATQQNGFVWMQLEVARNSESAHLAMGAHVSNAP